LTPWEGTVTRRGGVVTSTRGEVAPRREKRGYDVNCADVNITGPKNKENSHDRFSFYK
jgi:hypothetical protein